MPPVWPRGVAECHVRWPAKAQPGPLRCITGAVWPLRPSKESRKEGGRHEQVAADKLAAGHRGSG